MRTQHNTPDGRFPITRRNVLTLSGTTGVVLLSGCLSTMSYVGEQYGGDDQDPSGVDPGDTNQSGGGETEGYSADYESYSVVTDDTETIQVEIPDEWNDIYSTELDIGPGLTCSSDTDRFIETWNVAGMETWASTTIEPDLNAVLDDNSWESECQNDGRTDVSDDQYTVLQQFYGSCGGTDAAIQQIASTPVDESFVVYAYIQIVEERDYAAADRIYQSLSFTG